MAVEQDLVLGDAGLDQAQIVALEAGEATEGPLALVILGGVLVGARLNLGAHLGLVSVALSELFSQVVYVESGGLVEQSHLVEDALDVAGVSLLELPQLELLHLLGGHVQLGHALATVLDQILAGLSLPFIGVSLDGDKLKNNGRIN